MDVLSEVHFPHSLGLFYGMVTQFLGFKPDSDEWKVMALASYADAMGDTYDRLSKLIAVEDDGTFRLALEYFQHYNFWDRRLYSDVFVEEFGPPRRVRRTDLGASRGAGGGDAARVRGDRHQAPHDAAHALRPGQRGPLRRLRS